MQTLIYNAHLVLPDQLIENGWLLIEDGRILDLGAEVRCPSKHSQAIDGKAHFLLPGLVDLHCDAIEKLVEPRPNVHFDLPLALQEADVRLASCGITTEFHAISLDDDEFGVRSDLFVRELCQTLLESRDELLVRHKVHARLELSSQRGSDTIAQMIEQCECDMVSLMDHSPGQGQYRTEQAYRDYVMRMSQRSHAEIDAFLTIKRVQAQQIPERIERIARLVREAGLALATHDDDSAARVEQWPQLGVTVSEFPTTLEAAQTAHKLGLTVCMGAPNVLRGKSSGGNLSALTAIQSGVANALCSDYYPAAMLGATFALFRQQVMTLAQATRLVTLNPAQAVGLGHDYGSLEAGKVADLVLVGVRPQGLARVLRVFIAGIERLQVVPGAH